MRPRLTLVGMCILATLVVTTSANAELNRLTAIQVEEGPNNTVITIAGTTTPTFTVFKLLDPVRLLVDVAGGSVNGIKGSTQVRNGVVHDVETIQFKTSGRQIGRIVIGFDRDAPYSVKATKTKIRIVIDGTDRRLPSIQSEQTKQALTRAQKALQSEKDLRLRLEKAQKRISGLSDERAKADAERKRLMSALTETRGQIQRLSGLLKDKKNANIAAEKANRIRETKIALAESNRLAQERLAALREQSATLKQEKAAIAHAVTTAEKRHRALQKALAAEEARRKVAERARIEEEALARSAKNARVASDKRAKLEFELQQTKSKLKNALNKARNHADKLRKQKQDADWQRAQLKKELSNARIALKKAGKRRSAQFDSLQAKLKKTTNKNNIALRMMREALKKAEAIATKREREYRALREEFKSAEATLVRQLVERDQALVRVKAASAKAKAFLASRKKLIANLEARERARQAAQGKVESAHQKRIQAESKVRKLEEMRVLLEAQVRRLNDEKAALNSLVSARRKAADSAKLDLAEQEWLAAQVTELRGRLSRLSKTLELTETNKISLDKKFKSQLIEIGNVRTALAREKEDLAAVLQKKALFSATISELQQKNKAERRVLKTLNRQLDNARSRVKALQQVREQEETKLQETRAKSKAEEAKVALLKKESLRQQKLVHKLGKERDETANEVLALNEIREDEQRTLKALKAQHNVEKEQYKKTVASASEQADKLKQLKSNTAAEAWRLDKLSKLFAKESKRLESLQAKRDLAIETVENLTAKLASLKGKYADTGDMGALRRMLENRESEVVQLKKQLAQQQGALVAVDDKALKAALKRARTQAKKTKQGRKELKRLKRFIKSQQKQIAKLKGIDLEPVVKRQEREITILKDEITRLIESKSTTVELARLRDRNVRNALLAERRLMSTTQKQIVSLTKKLIRSKKKQASLKSDCAELKLRVASYKTKAAKLESKLGTAIGAYNSASKALKQARAFNSQLKMKLAQAQVRIDLLIAQRTDAIHQIAKLERDLKKTKKGRSLARLRGQLAKAKAHVQRLSVAIRNEKKLRKGDDATVDRQIELLLGQKVRLETKLDTQGRKLAQLKRQGGNAAEEIKQLNSRITQFKSQVSELKQQVVVARANKGKASELKQTLASVQRLKKALEKVRGQQQALQAELVNERNRRASAEKRLASKKAKRKSTTRITNVAFRERNNVSRVEISLDGKAGYELIERTDQRVVLRIDKVRMPKFLERRLDTSDFYGPIRMVSTFRDPTRPNSVKVVVDLADAVANKVYRKNNRVVWEFRNGEKIHMGTSTNKRLAQGQVRYEPTAVGGDTTGKPGARNPLRAPPGGQVVPGGGTDFGVLNPFPRKRKTKRYKGRKISLTIKDADIRSVLAFLAKEANVNIVASETVTGSVTLHLKDVPWDLALDMILKSKGLDYVVQDGVYRVAPLEVIQKEFEQEVEKRKKMTELKRLVVKLVTVNYADSTTLRDRVKDILSKKGSVSTDKRTNTLIIKDIEEHVIAAEDLVRRLDTETPQVLIEARIVEASSNFSNEMGIQWGGNYVASPAFGNETGLIFPGILGIMGAADDSAAPTGGLIDDSPNFAVNLPAAVGGGKGGGIGLSLGTLSGSGNVSLRLSAAEERGTVKIISSPRIATLDNKEAIIQQGISIPISVVSSLGVQTQFFSAQLKLQVTPHVTQDGNVALKLQITKNEPNFSQTGASGAPTIERKEAKTELLVRDGDTAVIGGIYTRNAARSYKKVPVLGDIPFLGWIFKSTVQSDKRSELILFVTPRIINRSASRVRVD